MSGSRTKNVAKNMLYGTVLQIISLLMDFILRTVFIHTLGDIYLGINGLFTNILVILSFAEMGIGDAIIFSMYKPILDNDEERLKALMKLFRNAYRIIGLTITAGGVLIIPFMRYFVKETPSLNENLTLIYCLFLVNTVVSYFFSYKKSIITAHQKNYIVIAYQKIFRIMQNIFQMIFLLMTSNFILFLLIMIFFTLVNNIIVFRKSERMFPYLADKKVNDLGTDEKRPIYANVRSLFVYKLGSVILNGTDNIIISIIIGIVAVGIVSNYVLVIGAVETILGQVMNAFTASVGNLNAGEDAEKQEGVFNKFLFIAVWINGVCGITMFLLLNEFMKLWIGNEYLLPQLVVFSLVIHFYINGVQFIPFTYRTTMGLFIQAKMAPVIASAVNLVLSVLLGLKFGLFGIFISTSVARLCAQCTIDPYFIFKKRFHKSPAGYYLKYYGYMIVTIVNCCFSYFALRLIPLNGWSGLAAKGFVCLVLSNLFYFLVFFRTPIFEEIKQSLGFLLKKQGYA